MENKIFLPADVLIPKTDLTKWSVIACDQYTSNRNYWNQVAEAADGSPSSLNVTLPEVYLEDGDIVERIDNINTTMIKYLDGDIFNCYGKSFILVKRTLRSGAVRTGIVGCVDLDSYEFQKGSESLIRPTEATVIERIPPRVKIRINAPLELPHVMLLADDPDNVMFSGLSGEKVYDFSLMMDGGRLEGYRLDEQSVQKVLDAQDKLLSANKGSSPLLFAVGDGNHSLATAKTCWNNLKNKVPADHPARYALVEIVNIYDSSLVFEPIHRVAFDYNGNDLIKDMLDYFKDRGIHEGNDFTVVTPEGDRSFAIDSPAHNLVVGEIQEFLDAKAKKIDYIHGEGDVRDIVSENVTGILLPAMDKKDLFPTVVKDGVLPRKTFSMGESYDKRYYTEARKIR